MTRILTRPQCPLDVLDPHLHCRRLPPPPKEVNSSLYNHLNRNKEVVRLNSTRDIIHRDSRRTGTTLVRMGMLELKVVEG